MAPPTIDLNGDVATACGAVDATICELFDWTATVKINDTASGLKSVYARNKQVGIVGPACNVNCTESLFATFRLLHDYEEGYTGLVEGIFAAKCCITGVEVVGWDMAGNIDTKMIYKPEDELPSYD